MPVDYRRLQITLSSTDLGQLLDGLRIRADAWQKTADYLVSGTAANAEFVCEECRDSKEARSLARQYNAIIEDIEEQVKRQVGW